MPNTSKLPHRVIYIGGYGRSGSTILSILLAQAPGTYCLGEIGLFCSDHEFEARADHLIPDQRWKTLIESRGAEPFLSERKSRAKRFLGGSLLSLFLPRKLLRSTRARLDAQICAYAKHTNMQDPILIDASKTARGFAARPFGLAGNASIDLRFVHIERECNKVVAAVARLRHSKHKVTLTWFIKLRANLGWYLANLVARHFQRLYPETYFHIKFEDLIADPEKILRNLALFVSVDLSKTMLAVAGHRSIPVPVMFGGNRLARNVSITLER